MTIKHTSEPWSVHQDASGDVFISSTETSFHIAEVGSEDDETVIPDARRIVACVNACAGMDNPAEEIEALKEGLVIATHQVITCGVAARHPDANLSRRESDYGGKWDSPQAESVRKLRQRHDELLAALELILDDCSRMIPMCAEEQARAAIAKAKGGSA